MGSKEVEKSKEKSTLKRSWFQELKAQFHKITWPDKDSLVKESVAVIVMAIIIGCIVALVDTGLHEGYDALLKWVQQLIG